jgi:Zn-dependent peptidase ImmA (M78 family)
MGAADRTMSQVKAEASRDAANLLGATWPLAIPVDPISIARRTGLRVVFAPLNDDTIGALIKQPHDEPTIMISERDSDNRKRFTCAHELGHYVRRSEETETYSSIDLRSDLSKAGSDPEEVYANEFAACLLMPPNDLRAYHATGLSDLEMAIRFKVSREAMQNRLRNLGLTEP